MVFHRKQVKSKVHTHYNGPVVFHRKQVKSKVHTHYNTPVVWPSHCSVLRTVTISKFILPTQKEENVWSLHDIDFKVNYTEDCPTSGRDLKWTTTTTTTTTKHKQRKKTKKKTGLSYCPDIFLSSCNI